MALDPITAGFDLAGKLIDRLWADPAQRDTAKLELLKMQQSGELAQLTAATDLAKGQIAVDQTEAGSSSFFVSGWRPFVGWMCASALGFQFIVAPCLTWYGDLHSYHIPFPALDTGTLMTLLFALLGIGGMRTAEKMKGVA